MSKHNAALSSATQYAMPPELSGIWGAEYLNTKLPLSTLLREGYSVKMKKNSRNLFSYLLFHFNRQYNLVVLFPKLVVTYNI